VALGILPSYVLLGLLTLPIAVKAVQGVTKNYGQVEQLVPALGQNVLVVLVTPLLMTIGLILAKFI
jgi:1,4-dihydroxy-2-naphthoate octaprenyltransferase